MPSPPGRGEEPGDRPPQPWPRSPRRRSAPRRRRRRQCQRAPHEPRRATRRPPAAGRAPGCPAARDEPAPPAEDSGRAPADRDRAIPARPGPRVPEIHAARARTALTAPTAPTSRATTLAARHRRATAPSIPIDRICRGTPVACKKEPTWRPSASARRSLLRPDAAAPGRALGTEAFCAEAAPPRGLPRHRRLVPASTRAIRPAPAMRQACEDQATGDALLRDDGLVPGESRASPLPTRRDLRPNSTQKALKAFRNQPKRP